MKAVRRPPRVWIHPAFDALYYSFYVEGLRRRFGKSALRLTTRGFPRLGSHGLALRLEDGSERRLFISASDGPGINRQALDWCDVYGKVNLDAEALDAEEKAKCLALGPGFPVRAWPPAAALGRALGSLLAAGGRVPSLREHLANYRRQYRYRLPESSYRPGTSEDGYVFFAATLWRKEPQTNLLRSRFVRAAREAPGLRFEGGFAPRRGQPVEGFEGLEAGRRYEIADYLERTRRSLAVFNTPAVSGCHGWKLGEFLALGKAIISTPPARALPAPLVHGEHLHLVDGSEEAIADALLRLAVDRDYRRHLEAGARDYYLTHLCPERAIQRLLSAAPAP